MEPEYLQSVAGLASSSLSASRKTSRSAACESQPTWW